MIEEMFSPQSMSWAAALLRLAGAVVFALAIGIERFLRQKPVDFRPFVIISLSSCALSMALLEMSGSLDDARLSIDPAKVMSGVMTGIGFLGTGALFREKHIVQGAGSAAAIWASGAIGIVCGLGFLWLGAMVALLIVAMFLAGRRYTDAYDARMSDDDEQR